MSNRLFFAINPENRIRKEYIICNWYLATACRLHALLFFFLFFFLSFQFLSLLIQLLIVPALLYFYLPILRRDLL
jgi:hypothetical protein